MNNAISDRVQEAADTAREPRPAIRGCFFDDNVAQIRDEGLARSIRTVNSPVDC